MLPCNEAEAKGQDWHMRFLVMVISAVAALTFIVASDS